MIELDPILFLKIFMFIAFAFILSIGVILDSIHRRINSTNADIDDLKDMVEKKTNIDYIEHELGKKDGVTQK